jgi:hypothetical protein
MSIGMEKIIMIFRKLIYWLIGKKTRHKHKWVYNQNMCDAMGRTTVYCIECRKVNKKRVRYLDGHYKKGKEYYRS